MYRVKAYISNGWDKRIVDPDPKKQYTQRKALNEQHAASPNHGLQEKSKEQSQADLSDWPKGPYTQQIEGVLPPLLTEELIMTHLQSSGKRLKKNKNYCNVDYSTLQRGHQYFMESYIPGRYVQFCCKENVVWIKARCYRSQKKNDAMHELKLAISSTIPYHVTRAFCSCVAGSSGICSHTVGLLKQLIHYVMMKLKSVPADLTCTQMQQTWHKPRPSKIESETVMNIAYSKAKQSDGKRDPVTCTLYEARAQVTQDYCFEQQKNLKTSLLNHFPSCAFAQVIPEMPPEEYINTPFGNMPKGSILSYHSLEYENLESKRRDLSQDLDLPALPLNILENVPCVYDIENKEQHPQLSKNQLTLDEAHALEQSTQQQSLSSKWKSSRIGRVTASRFGEILLRRSPPSQSFINSFFESKDYASLPPQLSHGLACEVKARNAYTTRTGFKVRTCGLVVNPSLPWLGASPDGLAKDPLEESVGLLEIKCPYTYRLSAVEDTASDPNFFTKMIDGKVTLKHDHKHYYQIQGQMALCRVSWCDFVIYTHCDFTIERIKFNEDFWDSIQEKLTQFYFKYILPRSCSSTTDDDL